MEQLLNIPVIVETKPGKKPSVPLEITKQLLETKRPRNAEIEVSLFENCNIKCDFCFLDQDSTEHTTFPEMLEKVKIMEKFMEERKGTVQVMQVNFLGGELFQDHWMEEKIEEYYQLATMLAEMAERYEYPMFRIIWVSNFIFKKKELVKGLIDRLRDEGIDNHLIVSYDFEGRPMSNRYKKHIDWFGPEYITSFSLVGTVASINKFMQDDDEYFKYLYSRFNIYFDSFIPEKGTDDMMPSDSLIYEWYKFMADKYPKIRPVSTLLANEKNDMTCLSLNKITIFPDNRTSNCRWHQYDQNDFKTEYNIDDNAGMMQAHLDEQGCLSCEYFQKCGLRCFTQADWRNRKQDMSNPKCPMKAFYNYVLKGIEYQHEPSYTDHTD